MFVAASLGERRVVVMLPFLDDGPSKDDAVSWDGGTVVGKDKKNVLKAAFGAIHVLT
jgi:hypothetical protein